MSQLQKQLQKYFSSPDSFEHSNIFLHRCVNVHFTLWIEWKTCTDCFVQSSDNAPETLLVCAFLFPPPPFPPLNVHISVSSFIMGPGCSSSQMSSPVAVWEGGAVAEKSGKCVFGTVCEWRGGTAGGRLGVGTHKSRLNGAHNCC